MLQERLDAHVEQPDTAGRFRMIRGDRRFVGTQADAARGVDDAGVELSPIPCKPPARWS